jgi:hypothetical protein
MSTKKEKEIDRLKDEFDMIQEKNSDFDISKHLAKMEDLPDLGSLEVYDYESDLEVVKERGNDIIESLVDLYLGDYPGLKEHPYLRNKIYEDAMVYAETLFLQKMTRKNFLSQLRQVDNGDNSARMHEVINQTITQIRENSKYAATQRNDLEKYYKDFRNDMSEVSPKSVENEASKAEAEDGMVMDNKKLNDMVNQMMKSKK